MAEIVDQLRLDIAQALRQVDDLGAAIDRALGQVEIGVDTTQVRQEFDDLARQADRALSDVDIDIDSSGVRDLEQSIRRVEEAASDVVVEVSAIELAADRAEVDFRDLAQALGISEDAARRLTGEILESRAAAIRLEEAARDVARQLDLSEDEAGRLTRELHQADRAADGIAVRTGGLVGAFGNLRTAAAGLVGAFAAIGGAQVFAGMLRGANEAIQSFAVLQDSINAVNVVFGNASDEVLQFGEDAAQSAGLSRQAFNQAVVPIGALLQNFGFDASTAADAAVTLVQRGADLASVYGGTVQDALLAVGAALRGEADPLERYGASISAARVQAFALAEGLASTTAELTPAVLLQARYQLILSDTARVAGDYAATSGDLANAQRTAGAELQNFVDSIGEQLAPALETIVVLIPEVIEGFRQLVPSFAAGAESAAAFFESVGEGGGFRTEFAAVKAGFDVITGGAGLAAEGVRTLFSVFTGNMQGATNAVQRGAALIERAFTRGIGIGLANALDQGVPKLQAFNTAVAQTAQQSTVLEIFTDNYRDFALAAGLTVGELQDATRELILNREELGLTAPEVEFLADKLNILNEELDTGGRANPEYLANIRGIGSAATEAGGPFGVFVDTVAIQAERLGTFTGKFQEASSGIAEALDPFAEASEAIETSAEEFFDNLVEQIEQQATFQANIARLIAAGFDDVAREIAEAGPGANKAAEEFLNNLALAEKAERLLDGEGTAIAQQVGSELAAELSSADLTRQQEQAFINLMEAGIFSNTQVQLAIASGTLGTAQEIARGVENAFGGVDFNIEIDLSEEGRASRKTYIDGLATPVAGEVRRVRDSIVRVVEGAIIRQSPPKLFLDYGLESGDAFWMGFDQAELAEVRTPVINWRDFVNWDAFTQEARSEVLPVFDELGATMAQRVASAFEGDFRLGPDFDPLTAEQLLSLNLDPTTLVIGPRDPLTVGQLREMVNAANEAVATVEQQADEIQFDFDLQAFQDQFADLTASSGEIGIAAREALMVGLSTPSSAEMTRLRQSILDTLNGAIQANSPPQLFVDAGTDARNAFWDAFAQGDLTMRTPVTSVTGSVSTTTTTAAGGGGDFIFAPSYVDTHTKDLETVVARSEQTVAAIAGLINGRIRNL